MQTEWQQYLTQCIETIALVAEVQPLQVFEQVVSVTQLSELLADVVEFHGRSKRFFFTTFTYR